MEMSDSEIIDIANPMMDNLMQASTEINHKKHVRDYTDRMKNIVTEDYLQKVCKKYQSDKGYFANREVMAVLKRPDSTVIIWRQTFTKASGEFLAEMLLVRDKNRYLIDHVVVL